MLLPYPDARLMHTHPLGAVHYIRTRWLKHGAPRVPPGIEKAMEALLCFAEEGVYPTAVLQRVSRLDGQLRS